MQSGRHILFCSLICPLHHLLNFMRFFSSYFPIFWCFLSHFFPSILTLPLRFRFTFRFLTCFLFPCVLSLYILFSLSPQLHNDLFVTFSLPTKQSRLPQRQFPRRMIPPPPRHFLDILFPSRRQVLHGSGEPVFLTWVQHNLFDSLTFNSLAAHEDLNTGISSPAPSQELLHL